MGTGTVGLLLSTATSLRQDSSYWREVGVRGRLYRDAESGPLWKTTGQVQNQPAVMPRLTQLSRTALGGLVLLEVGAILGE